MVSQLQPSIAAAVAQALAGSRRSSSVSVGSANREPEYADGPAEYNFEYKVADDEQQNYIARQESRWVKRTQNELVFPGTVTL